MSKSPRLAVFPGTFDPITNGHLDVIQRGVRLFDELVVAVGNNPEKTSMLDAETRVEIIKQATAGIDGVRVEMFSGHGDTARHTRLGGPSLRIRRGAY